MAANKLERELRRGSAELLILALLEERQRHGYEVGQLIASRSNGAINFHITSLYPTLYRLEDGGFIEGRWVERAGQRRPISFSNSSSVSTFTPSVRAFSNLLPASAPATT